MDLKDLIKRYEALNVYEKRDASEGYEELVFFTSDVDKWNAIFTKMLGYPLKPAYEEPTAEHENIAKALGGIRAPQTLYHKDFDDARVLAVFWPWGDNTHTTLKIAVFKK